MSEIAPGGEQSNDQIDNASILHPPVVSIPPDTTSASLLPSTPAPYNMVLPRRDLFERFSSQSRVPAFSCRVDMGPNFIGLNVGVSAISSI